IRDADVVLVVVDTVTGITEDDARVAEVVRDLATGEVILVANKVDDANREAMIWEAMSLGLGEPMPVSALHGRGSGEVLDRVVSLLPAPEPEPEADPDDELDDAREERLFS